MRYRFESLLRLRKNQENALQRQMGVINTHLYKQQDSLDELKTLDEQNRKRYNQRFEKPCDAKTMALYDNFFRGNRVNDLKQAQIVSEVEQRADEKREELNEAVKKRRIFEILKERHDENVRKERLKKEIAFMDEVANSRWKREIL